MPWFVIDDNADSHPKMIAAKNAAIGLWARVGAYVSRHLTDGIVPRDIAMMFGSKPQITRLVAVGLWHTAGHDCPHPKCRQPAPGDYYMHDYLEYNPSRRQVIERRERAAEKKRRQRGVQDPLPNRAGFADGPSINRGRFDDDSPTDRGPEYDEYAGHDAASPGDSSGTRARANPSPPLPSHAGGGDRETPAGGVRGRAALSQIAADWQPSDDDVQAAQFARADGGREQLTAQQIDAVTRKFRQRMLDDQVRAAGFGGRWQQWAENERTEATSGGGGVVVPFAQQPMTKSQQQRAGLDRLRERMKGGTAS